MKGRREYRGRLPGAKDKKPRFRRSPEEIAAGLTIEQAIKLRAEKVTKEELMVVRTERSLQRLRVEKELDDLDNLTRWELLNVSASKPKAEFVKEEREKCGVKIFASAVMVSGHARIKIQRKKRPDLAPCEQELFRITYEEEGIPVNSVFKKVRNLMGAIYYFAHLKSLE